MLGRLPSEARVSQNTHHQRQVGARPTLAYIEMRAIELEFDSTYHNNSRSLFPRLRDTLYDEKTSLPAGSCLSFITDVQAGQPEKSI